MPPSVAFLVPLIHSELPETVELPVKLSELTHKIEMKGFNLPCTLPSSVCEGECEEVSKFPAET